MPPPQKKWGTEVGILAKYPTGGLTRGEKKQIKSKIGKKTYWRTFKGGKKKIIGEKGQNKYDVCEERCFVVATSFLGAIHKLGSKKYRN